MSDPGQTALASRPRRWRWVLLSFAGTVVIAVGGVLLHHAWQLHVTGQELQASVAELDRADPRWRYEDVDADRLSPPEGRNSADVAVAAQRLLPKDFPSRAWTLAEPSRDPEQRVSLEESFQAWPDNVRLSAPLLEGLRGELRAGEAALVEARRLADMPEGRYALEPRVDYLNTLLPHFERLRAVVWLLCADAVVRAEEGDAEGAWTSLLAAVNGARSVGDDPTLIGVLLRTAGVVAAVRGAERLVALGESGPEALATLQELLEREERETVPSLETALRAERALGHRMMDAIEAGRLDPDQALQERHGAARSAWEEVLGFFSVPWVRHSHAVYLRMATDHVELARRPLPEWRAEIVAGSARPKDKNVPLAELLASSVWKVLEAVQRKEATLRCATASLAAERFRRGQGRWPEQLAELTPGYLKGVPADPYDGAPLRMRRTEDGLVIYSVGPDGTDDGGEFDRKSPTRKGADLAFRLWDVNRRRLDPPSKPPGHP